MATIFCFSSTGNSLYTAKRLAEKIGGKVKPMNRESIQIEDDVIGFVFPVYFWGMPRMMERFVSKIQITNKNSYVFAVVTFGGLAHGVLGWLKKLLETKNVHLKYGVELKSVENYIPMYLPKDTNELREKIDKSIIDIANAINSQICNKVKAVTFLNKLVYNFYPNEKSDKYFTVSPTCTGCGICKKVCIAKNISMKDNKPEFLHKCEHCLACIHNCPSLAIEWKEKTKSKSRYRNAGVSLDELISFNCMKDV